MPAIIAMITSFFGFFTWEKVVDFFFKTVSFSSMVVVNLFLFGVISSYFFAVVSILDFIYTKFNYIVDYVNNFSVGNDKVITTAIMALKSLGAWNALCDVMVIFSPIFLSFFLVYAVKIGIVVYKFARETILSFVVSKS